MDDDFLGGQNLRRSGNSLDDCGCRGIFCLCLLRDLAADEGPVVQPFSYRESDPGVVGRFSWSLVFAAEVNILEYQRQFVGPAPSEMVPICSTIPIRRSHLRSCGYRREQIWAHSRRPVYGFSCYLPGKRDVT